VEGYPFHLVGRLAIGRTGYSAGSREASQYLKIHRVLRSGTNNVSRFISNLNFNGAMRVGFDSTMGEKGSFKEPVSGK